MGPISVTQTFVQESNFFGNTNILLSNPHKKNNVGNNFSLSKEPPKHTKQKLDMGKSCVRFKKFDDIPFKLIGQLMQKISVEKWIKMYETNLKK